ncbi:MAG TPA: hypothetical protein VGN57_09305 [Pirellulaceae bacterium]|jgi:hypothetical protein|nr:hypothetical protein [Pirellulaceae bacterium]
MRIRITRRRPKPAEIPWWVWLGVLTKHGFVRERPSAIFNAWMATIIAPVALIVSVYSTGSWQRFALVGGVMALPIALHQWLAIRWLDRRKAWRLTRESPPSMRVPRRPRSRKRRTAPSRRADR